ncbi:hypothetical protein BH11MYX3_BH11MYX3_48820 [soil metagenome]
MLGSFSPLRTTNSHLAYWHRGAVARGKIVVSTDEATDVFASDGKHLSTVPADRRDLPSLTTLPDGQILAIGGYSSRPVNGVVLASCMLFDVDTLTWTDAPSLSKARVHHATVTCNGAVVVIGGCTSLAADDPGQAFVESWTPGSYRWTPLPALPRALAYPAAATLTDDSVIVAEDGAWLWDGVDWRELEGAPRRSRVALVPLAKGGVLMIGGRVNGADVADVDAYIGGAWTSLGPMVEPREQAAACELGDGRIVVIGGMGTRMFDRFGACTDVEVRGPDLDWSRGSGFTVASPQLVRIDDARVLVSGGCAPGIWTP